MNKQEIDAMMRHLPSQRDYYRSPKDEILAGLLFVMCVLILCFM